VTAQVLPTSVQFQRGVPVQLSVVVHNPRDVISGVAVRVLGADPGWVEITEPQVSLFPGESRTVSVTLRPPEALPAGQRQITVQVRELTAPFEVTLAPVTVEVPEHDQLALRIEPLVVQGGRHAVFAMVAENRGNTTIRSPLCGQDEEGKVRFEFRPARLNLAPGEQMTIELVTHARRRITGTPVPRSLSVHADDRTPAERRDGVCLPQALARATFLQRPWLSRAAVSLGGLVAAVALFAGVSAATVGGFAQQSEKDRKVAIDLALAAGDPQNQNAANGHCPCTLTGQVVATTGQAAVTGLTALLFAGSDPQSAQLTATTSQDGTFTFRNLAAGSYLVQITGSGHVPSWYPNAAGPDTAQKIVVFGYAMDSPRAQAAPLSVPAAIPWTVAPANARNVT
jgi:hypothetical protein